MRRRGARWRYGKIVVGLIMVVAAVPAAARLADFWWGGRRRALENVTTTPVKRTDLWVSVTSSGLIESANQTVVECELESLEVSVRGRSLAAGGSSVIISLVPDGSHVKEGDVLCELDASDYVELERQQEMNVERAKADYHLAELDLEVAKLAVREFREGLWHQNLKELENQGAIAQADWERAADRLEWSVRMLEKGYLSLAQYAADTSTEQRTSFLRRQALTAAKIYRRYTAPRIRRELINAVRAAQAVMDYETARLGRHVERLQKLRSQVEHCTIRAPHDGFVIYANDPRKQFVLEAGISVRQKQRIFYLPDLSKMEVSALLHESIVADVRSGMRAKVRIEGLANRILEGSVISVARLPTRSFFSDVPYYAAQLAIDSPPRGLLPGMSAEVEISTDRRSSVLTVPAASVTSEDGQDVCYVADDDGLERREVELGKGALDQLEITRGLDEGEQVVLNPSGLGVEPKAVAEIVDLPDEESPVDAAY